MYAPRPSREAPLRLKGGLWGGKEGAGRLRDMRVVTMWGRLVGREKRGGGECTGVCGRG